MRTAPAMFLIGFCAFLPACTTSTQEQHYDIRFRNAADRPVTVELLGLDRGGSNKVRADLTPGGEYVGSLSGYGPGYLEARVRLSDEPDPRRFYIFEMPRSDLRREVVIEEGRPVLRKFAPNPEN